MDELHPGRGEEYQIHQPGEELRHHQADGDGPEMTRHR